MKETSSAGGIVVRDGKIVLVCQAGVSWSFPKGHIEKGETPLRAAKREIYEECGLKRLELVREFGAYRRKGGKELKTIHLFLFRTSEEKLRPMDRSITGAVWIDIEKVIETLTNARDKEFFMGIKNEIIA